MSSAYNSSKSRVGCEMGRIVLLQLGGEGLSALPGFQTISVRRRSIFSVHTISLNICIAGPVAELQSLTILSDDAEPSSLLWYKKATAGDVQSLIKSLIKGAAQPQKRQRTPDTSRVVKALMTNR